jgi:phosphatidylglycerophosphatase A
MRKIIMLIATGLGTGYCPVSGTVASALAVALYLPVAYLNTTLSIVILFYIGIVICLTGLSILTATRAAEWLGEKDPHKVVIDEIAGYFYAMFLLPATPLYIGASFIIFRLFDIWKPFPIRQSQRLPGGLGITIDDVLAGIYTCVLLHVIRLTFHL